MKQGKIVRVAGPLVIASECLGAKMYDMVKIGSIGLIGEVIELKEDRAYIQVYEDTTGIGPGEPVFLTGLPLSVELRVFVATPKDPRKDLFRFSWREEEPARRCLEYFEALREDR